MRFSFRMAVRLLRGDYLPLTLTVLALAGGVALVCAIDLATGAALHAVEDVIDTLAGRAALQVTAGEAGLVPEDVATTVGEVPGVEVAAPVVSATAFMADDSGETMTVQGIDIANDAAVRVYEARGAQEGLELTDPLVFLAQPDSVMLTRTFAEPRRITLGDRIALETPTGRRNFTVRGLLEPQGVARVLGGNLVVMDVYAAEAAFTRPGFVNRIDLVVEPGRDVTQIADAVSRVLPPGLRVDTPSGQTLDPRRLMHSFRVILKGVGLVGLLAAFLIGFSRLATVFEARAWQLGIMRAIGVRRRVVWRELLKQSLLLGAAGVALGIPLGVALGSVLRPVIAASAELLVQREVPHGQLSLDAVSFSVAAALGLATAVLSAALPAWRAARVEIAEVLRSRGLEQRSASVSVTWVIRALVAMAVVGTVLLQSATRAPAWGVAATALIAAATALAARPLLHVLQPLASPRFHGLVGPSTRFVVATILYNPRRAALAIGLIGVGLGSVLWLVVWMNSFERSLISRLSQLARADLIVASAHSAAVYEAPVDETLVAELSGVPGIATVVGSRVVMWPHENQPIAIHAIDPVYFTTPAFGEFPLVGYSMPGLWDAVARGESVIVSSNFVVNFRARVGDPVVIEAPSGPLELPVGGITAAGFDAPRGVIVMSRELFVQHWRDRLVNRAFVHLDPGRDVSEVRAAVARRLGTKHRLRIISTGSFIDYYVSLVRRVFAPIEAVAAMMLGVVLLGLLDTLAAGVAERTRQLGTVRAVGLRRRRVRSLVLMEGTMLGALGLVLTAAAGLGLGVLWIEATVPYLVGFVLDLYVPYQQVGVMAVISLALCLASGWLPARRAASLEPAAALRRE